MSVGLFEGEFLSTDLNDTGEGELYDDSTLAELRIETSGLGGRRGRGEPGGTTRPSSPARLWLGEDDVLPGGADVEADTELGAVHNLRLSLGLQWTPGTS